MTTLGRFRLSSILGALVLAVAAGMACGTMEARQNDARDAADLWRVLQLSEGAAVAEIGAGAGELTVEMARRVGPRGRVYTTEISERRLDDIRRAVADLPQVTVLEAHATRTNLPEACCDAIFMRDVYHHFDEPAPMTASLLASLKPGGRLGIIDFAPRGGGEAERPEARDSGRHGILRETLARELREAGFEIVEVSDRGDRNYLLVARKR